MGSLELRGSITTMGGGVFFSNWIDDSFAVVATGVPDVEVLSENRRAGARKETTAALVTFVGPDNHVLPVGAVGHMTGGEGFVVGYDGQVYIKGLSSMNEAEIELADSRCRATFAFVPSPGEQVRIPGVECR